MQENKDIWNKAVDEFLAKAMSRVRFDYFRGCSTVSFDDILWIAKEMKK